ncbi:MAG: site-specific integrase [Gammaproteobacteria bacterium PRO9]|nr:site-specific integrase [Gammaproteobacteria bacterium PRO9]
MPRRNRGPYIKPNALGYFEIVHYSGGKPRTLSTRTKNPAAAEKALAEYILGDQAVNQENGWPVADVWDIYWREHVLPRVIDQDRMAGTWKHLQSEFGDKLVQRLRPEDFERYVGKRLMWVQPATVRRELSVLTAALNHMVKTKRLKPSQLPYIPLPPVSPPRDRWLTAEEITALHRAAEARAVRQHAGAGTPLRLSRVQRFLHIVLNTGARRRVVEKLTWDRVDFQRGLIDFNYGGPQSKKRKPVVPISDALRVVLIRAYDERKGPFVLDHSGAIRRAFDATAAEAGLPGVHRHTLRHTWATHASMNGVDLLDIARVLGNSLEMVRKVYAHHQPEYLRRAVNFTPKSFETPAQQTSATPLH